MVLKQLEVLYSEVNEELIRDDLKNFSKEFIKLYKDIEEDEHLFVGAVSYYETPF